MVRISDTVITAVLQTYENILPWAVRSIIAFMFPFDRYKISLTLAAGRYNSAKMVLSQMSSTRRDSILRALILGVILFPYISIGFLVTIFENSYKTSDERTYTFSSQSVIPYIDTYQTLKFNKLHNPPVCNETLDIIQTLRLPGTTGSLDCNKIGNGKAENTTLRESGLHEYFLNGARRFRNQSVNDVPVGGVTAYFVPINTFMINSIYYQSDVPEIYLGGSGDAHTFSSYYTSFHGFGNLNHQESSHYIKIDINSTNKYEREITEQIFDQKPYSKFKGCLYKTDVCELVDENTTSFLTFKNVTSPMSEGAMITIADVQVWTRLFDRKNMKAIYMIPFRVFADYGAINSTYFKLDRYQTDYKDPDLTGIMQALHRSSFRQDGQTYIKYYDETVTNGYRLLPTIFWLAGLTIVYTFGVFCNFNGFTAAQSHVMDTMYASVFERKEDCMNNFQSLWERMLLPDKYLRSTYRYVGLRRSNNDIYDHGTLSIDGEYITKVARVSGPFEEIDVHGGREIRKTVGSWEIKELKRYESAAEKNIPRAMKISSNLSKYRTVINRKMVRLEKRRNSF